MADLNQKNPGSQPGGNEREEPPEQKEKKSGKLQCGDTNLSDAQRWLEDRYAEIDKKYGSEKK